jgi:ATP-binding cassette subfamily C protein CydD
MIDRRLLDHARQIRGTAAALGLTFGLSLALGLLAVGQAWLLSRIVGGVYLHSQDVAALRAPLALLAVVIVLRAAAVAGTSVAGGTAAVRVKTDLRRALLGRLLAVGPALTVGERTGELTATAVQGIEALDAYFRHYLPQIGAAFVIPLTLIIVAFPVDPLSAVIWLVTAPLIPLFMVLIGRAAEALTRRQFDLLGRLSAHFLDVLQGLTTLRQLSQSRRQTRVIRQVSDDYARATLGVLRVAFLSALTLELVASISTAIVAVTIGLRLLYGRMEFQPALFILILTAELYLPLRMLGQRFHASAAGVAAAKRIDEVLALPPEVAETRSRPMHDVRPYGPDIAFENVDYSYGEGRARLRQVSFRVEAGSTVALVGRSGAGKSTLAHLLLRFIQPGAGRIAVAGQDLEEWPVADWRRQVAWVPQAPHLFHDSIEANIRLARPEATPQQVIEAAQAAHLHAFVSTLPEGYRTRVGEGGERLSGGQAQRLALARAFLRAAPVLILDEPTSSVDPELEQDLLESTDRLMRDRTVLVIAHRLATAHRADGIVVLDRGVVVETGRHADLIARGGLYHRLVASSRLEDGA